MLISCPNCEFSREIDDSKVPEWAKAFKCPGCGKSIPLVREQSIEWLTEAQDQDFAFETTEPSSPSSPPPFPSEKEPTSEIQTQTDIPWESRQGGFFRYFFSTIGGVLFRPSRFFDNMRPINGYLRPMFFVVIIAYLQAVFSESIALGLQHVLADVIAGIQSPIGRDLVEKLIGIKMYHPFVIAILVISPWLSPIFQFVLAYLVQAFLPSSKDKGYEIQSTYRIVAYCTAANIFGAIPIIGWLVSFVWSIKIITIGLSRVYQISADRLFWNVVGAYIVTVLVFAAFFNYVFDFLVKLIV